ncbi:MAG: VOC family protein [Fimbriimonadaceae bacterium]|nr:VOC family protein [Fimbriimonadaceae bacterium]
MNAVIEGAGIHHVAVRTVNYAETLTFYQEILGLQVAAEWTAADGRELALLDIGDGSFVEVIAFGQGQPVPEGGQFHPWMHLALRCSNPDAVYQKAIDAGYGSVITPRDVQLAQIRARIAFFQGPNGEVIELFWQQS